MSQILYNENLAYVLVILTIISLLLFTPIVWQFVGGITLSYNTLGVLAFIVE
jgi:hypothetical protein